MASNSPRYAPIPVGQQFGCRTVIAAAPKPDNDNHHRYVLVLCQCGAKDVMRLDRLTRGSSTACPKCKKPANVTHGLSKSREYHSWLHMRNRCQNSKNPRYADYGGRGITVSPRWDNFELFFADMGPCPSLQHSLDRTDNEQGYSPGNCRWATPLEQSNNRSDFNVPLSWKDRTQNVCQWARELKMEQSTLSWRIRQGWSIERAFTTPTYTGGKKLLKQVAKELSDQRLRLNSIRDDVTKPTL